jgi:hypothetical protein
MTQAPQQPPSRRNFSVEELNRFVPGLGTIMPEIGTRAWKLYYAGKAGNWKLAEFQLGELQGLMMTGALTRPLYEADLKSFVADFVSKVREALATKDVATFEEAFHEMISMANEFHEGVDKGFIVWKIPDMPPPDLDLTPKE